MKLVKIILFISAVMIIACSNGKNSKNDEDFSEADVIVTDQDSDATEKDTDFFINDNDINGDSDSIESDQEIITDAETEDGVETDDNDQILAECPIFKTGVNEIVVNGEESKNLTRKFILDLPENIEEKTSWPLIFAWHGVGDSASNFRGFLGSSVDNTIMPFILVTPEDAGYSMETIPPEGVDWDNLVLANGSIEAEFFDTLMPCLKKQFGIDEKRIYMTGMSAGSIATDSLAVLRGEQLASIFTYSGAYFSNPKNPEDLGTYMGFEVASFISWPEMKINNKFVQLFMHGAEGDESCTSSSVCDKYGFNGFYINFNHMARFDAPYLNDLGHDTILCNHGKGHTIAGLNKLQLIRFFYDHPKGTVNSVYKDGFPEDWPKDLCVFNPKK